jgi:hypothetical protein
MMQEQRAQQYRGGPQMDVEQYQPQRPQQMPMPPQMQQNAMDNGGFWQNQMRNGGGYGMRAA